MPSHSLTRFAKRFKIFPLDRAVSAIISPERMADTDISQRIFSGRLFGLEIFFGVRGLQITPCATSNQSFATHWRNHKKRTELGVDPTFDIPD